MQQCELGSETFGRQSAAKARGNADFSQRSAGRALLRDDRHRGAQHARVGRASPLVLSRSEFRLGGRIHEIHRFRYYSLAGRLASIMMPEAAARAAGWER